MPPLRRLLTTLAPCLLPTVTAAASPNIQPILLPNQPLPDASGDLVAPDILYTRGLSLSRTGDVAIAIQTYDPSSPTSWFDQEDSATLLWSAGSLSTLVHTGDTFGPAGGHVLYVAAPAFSPNGRFLSVGIDVINNGPDTFNAYLLDRTTGSPAPFVPIINNPSASSPDTPQINNAGTIAVTVSESNATNVLTGPPGQFQHLITAGASLPGGDTAIESHAIVINPAGQTLFTSSTDLNSPGATNLYLGTPGNLQTLAARNTSAPGIPNALFSDIQTPAGLSDTGRTAFAAAAVAPGLHTTNDQGVWVGSPNSLHLLAREGDPAPNTANQIFASFSNPTISADGHVAFLAGFTSSPNDGGNYAADSLWLSDPAHADQLAKVAAVGDPTPGLPTGTFSNFSGFTLSSTGLIAFTADALIPRDADDPVAILANLLHQDPSPITTTGLWFGPPGDLHLLLQKNDPFTLNGQTVYIDSFNLAGSAFYNNGNTLPLTDDGRILLYIGFHNADSTSYSDGLFLLSTPEPLPLLSLLPLTPTLLSLRPRRRFSR